MEKMEKPKVYKMTAKFHFPNGIDLEKAFECLKKTHNVQYTPETNSACIVLKIEQFSFLINKSGYATIYITPGDEKKLPKVLRILWTEYLKKCKP